MKGLALVLLRRLQTRYDPASAQLGGALPWLRRSSSPHAAVLSTIARQPSVLAVGCSVTMAQNVRPPRKKASLCTALQFKAMGWLLGDNGADNVRR